MSHNIIFIPIGTNGTETYLGVEAKAVRRGVFELTHEPRDDVKTAYHKGDHVHCEFRPIETPHGEELMQIVTGKAPKA
jgi:hypothetical protein